MKITERRTVEEKQWLSLSKRSKEGMEKPGFANNRYQVALLQTEYTLLFLDDVTAPGRRLRVTLMGM